MRKPIRHLRLNLAVTKGTTQHPILRGLIKLTYRRLFVAFSGGKSHSQLNSPYTCAITLALSLTRCAFECSLIADIAELFNSLDRRLINVRTAIEACGPET